jgi:putative aldouronate transport system permease protein
LKFEKITLMDYIIAILLAAFCLTVIMPFVYLINLSLSEPDLLNGASMSLFLWPEGFSLNAYTSFLTAPYIESGFQNTILRTVVGTFGSLAVMSMAAYALSRTSLPHYRFLTMFVIVTMFFNGGIIPQYLLIKALGLYDTFWVLIFSPVTLFVNGFFLLILRNFFLNIPEELEEAAEIDGAGKLKIFLAIVLPMSVPVLATVALWQAVYHWNAWFDGLMYITSPEKQVIQVHIRRLVIEQNAAMMDRMVIGREVPTPESLRSAAIIVATVPILLVYPFIQRFFRKGIMVGAVKG